MKFFIPLLSTILCLTSLFSHAQESTTSALFPANSPNYQLFPANRPPLLPSPQSILWADKTIPLSAVNIIAPEKTAKLDPDKMALIIQELTGFLKSHKVAVNPSGYPIRFKLVENLQHPEIANIDDEKRVEEAFQIIASAKETTICATDTKGLFYGFQTIKQLIIRRNAQTTLALCSISDWPAFRIRGFMNDVGRNYMSLPLIKEEIEALALLKLNTYHFHFTENEGWRLESKLFPELNKPENFSRKPGKFYTQKEFVELVEFCRLRNIQLIPEMDMPGHSACFRKALGIKTMAEPQATATLVKLIKEMCSLVPAEKMPYIHIGTDEVRSGIEQVDEAALKQYFATVEECGRKPIHWHPGLNPKGYNNAVLHLWTGRQSKRAWPTDNSEYIDSLETYINHLDPFETAMTMFFRRFCPFSNAKGLGTILCSWPDLPIEDERNQVLQTPIYSAMTFGAESLWRNPHGKYEGDPMNDEYMKYFSNLPAQGDPLLQKFAECENRVLAIRDRFFRNKEFNYVRQANIPWKLLGPIPHGGNVDKVFAPEEDILNKGKSAPSYSIDGKEYSWLPSTYTGATLIFKHYCDFPTMISGNAIGSFPAPNSTYYATTWIYSPKKQSVPFWISGHTWSTSDWRHGPASVPGKWFHANPKFWINGKEIAPPVWEKPNNSGGMVDENYHCRKPTILPLKKGWNQILVKSPANNSTRRWMFTFVPVLNNPKTPGTNVTEFPGLKFSADPEKKVSSPVR